MNRTLSTPTSTPTTTRTPAPAVGGATAGFSALLGLARRIIDPMEAWITPLFHLAIRVHVGWVFFQSGLVKVSDWSTTVLLFQNEYQVPVLPPALAAAMGTAGELALPVLLVLGLAGRFGAAGLFVMNAVAVISYPELSDLGKQDHLLWGALLLVTVLHGPGRFSLDRWIANRYSPV